MSAKILLRGATPDDRAFVEQVYFEPQRWLVEKLFGWRGDDVERAKFDESYDAQAAYAEHCKDQSGSSPL